MRYHYEKPEVSLAMYGYNVCTLYKTRDRGLAVIQQRFDPNTKTTKWTEIDSFLQDELYLHPKFQAYFKARSGACKDGLYPTVTVRQIMWAFKMKPLPKERWETVFDRKSI